MELIAVIEYNLREITKIVISDPPPPTLFIRTQKIENRRTTFFQIDTVHKCDDETRSFLLFAIDSNEPRTHSPPDIRIFRGLED